MKQLLLSAFAVAMLAGCKKDDVKLSPPEIELVAAYPLDVVQFGERVRVRFSYKDADGDLGFPDPDSYALEVKEARLDTPDWYHIPPMAPEGVQVPIQGELEVELDALFLLGNGEVETTSYSMRIRDRAGQWSNTITTPIITITMGDQPE